jgi:uncharacterized membrane protein YeiH
MDVFGVLVLALIAALGGGIVRDLLLGVAPPASLRNTSNLVAALTAAATCFFFHARLERIGSAVAVFDAVGLGLFSVTGALEALQHGLGAIAATLLGVVTGVGGGALRDVLANEVPFVLEREIYALAALVGAGLAVASSALGITDPWAAALAAACATTLRLLALRFGWEAPRPLGL